MWLGLYSIIFHRLEFLLTHPVWDVTLYNLLNIPQLEISTHTSRVGCDFYANKYKKNENNFYSHIPCGMWLRGWEFTLLPQNFYSHIPCGMWQMFYFLWKLLQNFYSHIPCGMWRNLIIAITAHRNISTHTSRVGCDHYHCQHPFWRQLFLLTHPVWDVTIFFSSTSANLRFLLTHPVWDVTSTCFLYHIWIIYFYSHIPCGMWPVFRLTSLDIKMISTHTSRVGCDLIHAYVY